MLYLPIWQEKYVTKCGMGRDRGGTPGRDIHSAGEEFVPTVRWGRERGEAHLDGHSYPKEELSGCMRIFFCVAICISYIINHQNEKTTL